jgi:hypothetical protein
MKSTFDPLAFARTLLAEALYFDDEHGSIGSVSLVDSESGKELYMASFDPESEMWLLEEAVEWDDDPVEGLLMATDGTSIGEFDDPFDIAGAVIDLAASDGLTPVFLPLFEEPL